MENLITKRDAAATLGVSICTVDRLISAGDLPVIRIGRNVRIMPEDLRQYIDSRRCRALKISKIPAKAAKPQAPARYVPGMKVVSA